MGPEASIGAEIATEPPSSGVWRAEDHPSFAGPALIDTHVWIWYLDGAEGVMHAAARELLRQCVRREGLVVSDISVWEVGTKVCKGKLALMPSVEAWVERAARRPGFSFLPLDRQILLASTQLPGAPHGDPADRMLIASAALSGMALFTADPSIIDYARVQGGFSVCDVRG